MRCRLGDSVNKAHQPSPALARPPSVCGTSSAPDFAVGLALLAVSTLPGCVVVYASTVGGLAAHIAITVGPRNMFNIPRHIIHRASTNSIRSIFTATAISHNQKWIAIQICGSEVSLSSPFWRCVRLVLCGHDVSNLIQTPPIPTARKPLGSVGLWRAKTGVTPLLPPLAALDTAPEASRLAAPLCSRHSAHRRGP